MSLGLTIDRAKFDQVKTLLAHIEGGLEVAVLRSLNRGAEKIRTDAVKYICERYTIKPSDVRRRIHIIRATRKRLAVLVVFSSPMTAMRKFVMEPAKPPKQRGIPIALREKVQTEIISGEKKSWPHAFLIKNKAGKVDLYRHSKTVKREIRGVFGPPVSEMIGHPLVLEKCLEEGKRRLYDTLDQQVKFMLETGQTKTHGKKHSR